MKHSLVAPSLLLALVSCSTSSATHSGSERVVAARDGTRIVYDVRGRGPTTLVFVHCWGGSRAFWRGQLDAFADRYRVAALDLPGHGESGKDRAVWSITGYGDDVRAVVEHAGLHDVVLIGHSMGGPVSLAAAKLMPGRVRAVLLLDTIPDADLPMPKERFEQIEAALRRDFAGTMRTAVAGMFGKLADPEVVEWTIAEALKTDPQVATALFEDFPRLDLRRLLQEAGVPVRAINSSASPWPTSIENNRKYADFDAIELDGVGHFLQLERPELVNQAIRTTLARLGLGAR